MQSQTHLEAANARTIGPLLSFADRCNKRSEYRTTRLSSNNLMVQYACKGTASLSWCRRRTSSRSIARHISEAIRNIQHWPIKACLRLGSILLPPRQRIKITNLSKSPSSLRSRSVSCEVAVKEIAGSCPRVLRIAILGSSRDVVWIGRRGEDLSDARSYSIVACRC